MLLRRARISSRPQVVLHRLLQLNIIFNFSMGLAYNCSSKAISAVLHCGAQACSGVLRLSSATDRFADSLRVGERGLCAEARASTS
jgi:hypothetical protein